MKIIFSTLLSFLFLHLPKVDFGQAAPNFGKAGSFAILTISGAVGNNTNSSTTTVNGDVGSLSADPGGYTSVNGKIYDHTTDAAALGTATTDLRNAYNYLNGLTLTGTAIAGAQTYGTASVQQVFTPGVYEIDAAVTLTNIVYDAQGNANALFVFNVHGALDATASSKMALTGGATASNIFWTTTAGAISLAASTNANCSFIADGALSYGDGAVVTGSGYSVGGAITTYNNTITKAAPSVLPITLINFTAVNNNGAALLNWATASETNSKSFTVESSTAANGSWNVVGVLPAAGTSTTVKNYSLYDNKVSAGNNYYRLRSTDMDGTSTLSNIAVLYFNAGSATTLKAYPNPFTNNLTITGAAMGSYLKLVDMTGKTLIVQPATNNSVNLMETSKLSSGIYMLQTVSSNGSTTSIKLNKF